VRTSALRRLAQRIAGLEFWLLGLTVVASSLWPDFLPLAVVLGVIFCFVRWFAFGKPGARTPVDWGIFLLTTLAFFSLWKAYYPDIITIQVFRLLAGIAFFISIVNWGNSESRIGWLVILMSVAAACLAVFGVISVEWVSAKAKFLPSNIYSMFQVLVSDPIHPNVMAGSLVLFAPALCVLIMYKAVPPSGRKFRYGVYLLYILSLMGVLSVIFLTQSRGAFLAFFLALGALIMLRWRRGWIFLIALGLTGLVIVNISGISLSGILLDSQTFDTLDKRQELWFRAFLLVSTFPWTGVGMGMFNTTIGYLMPLLADGSIEIIHVHNIYLQIAVDLGIPGLVAWISILIVTLAVSWKLFKTGSATGEPWLMGLGAGLFCSGVALITHGMIDSVVWGLRSAPIVWFIWGVTIAAGRVYLGGGDKQKLQTGLIAG
jgi:putative inorganic carbon (HCO3(-)) transporter